MDPVTGLVQMKARWYDPDAGIFISEDPRSYSPTDPFSLHEYLYANADPVNNYDPTGKKQRPFWIRTMLLLNCTAKQQIGGTKCKGGCRMPIDQDNQLAMNGAARKKKYVFVLQMPAESINDYDEMIALEEKIIGTIGNLGAVDGHDAGSGEMNIFIHTDSPKETFKRIEFVLRRSGQLTKIKAAYRETGKDDYTVIHPPGLASFRIS